MNSPSRRTLLANCAVGVTGIASLTGCLAEGNDDSDSESDDDSDGGDNSSNGSNDSSDSSDDSSDGNDGSQPDGCSNESGSESDEESTSDGGGVSQVEIDAEIVQDDQILYTDDLRGRIETVVVGIVDENGESVSNGRVMVASGSAKLETPQTAEIGNGTDAFEDREDTEELASNQVGFGFTHEDEPAQEGEEVDYTVGLRSDQNQGTLEIEIFPPADSDYTDALRNSEIVVIEGSDDEGSGQDA